MPMNNPVLILYLEDNPRDAELVGDKLRQSSMPHDLRIATGRAEYEAALAQTRFDLIISDYALPDYDGFAALTLALEKQPYVPFILISGTLSEEQAVECLRRGATDYVIKQNLKRLVPAVLRALSEAGERQKRRMAEAALEESEKRFMDVIYAAQDAILLVESEKFVDCNEATAQMLGYASRDAFLMIHPSQLSPPLQPDGRQSFEKANEMMQTAIANGPNHFEWVHRRANGEDFPVEVSLTAISYGGKTVLHCLWRDITERKRAAETLRTSEAKYRALIETTKTGYLILDMEGKVVDANPEYVQLTGHRDLHEILGRSVIEWTAEYEKERNAQAVAQCTRDGFIRGFEVDYVDGPGRITPIEINATVVRDGETIRILSLCHDITERKQAEQELREAKALTDAIVEHMPLMVFLKEATDLRFVVFNRAGEELLGYDRKALLGKNNLDLFPPEQAARFMAKDREALAAQGVVDIPEEPIQTARKGERLLHTRKVCIRGADGKTKYMLGISEDITEHKRAEVEMENEQSVSNAIIEGIPGTFYMLDENGKYVRWSALCHASANAPRRCQPLRLPGHLDHQRFYPVVADAFCAGVGVLAGCPTPAGRTGNGSAKHYPGCPAGDRCGRKDLDVQSGRANNVWLCTAGTAATKIRYHPPGPARSRRGTRDLRPVATNRLRRAAGHRHS
jgi:PAS domain S-box-containing protein